MRASATLVFRSSAGITEWQLATIPPKFGGLLIVTVKRGQFRKNFAPLASGRGANIKDSAQVSVGQHHGDKVLDAYDEARDGWRGLRIVVKNYAYQHAAGSAARFLENAQDQD